MVAACVLWLTGCALVLTPVPTATPPSSGPGETFRLETPTIAPEIYLTPVPPTPTFTPSPTPTPVIHVVEEGDTLFGIALEYGVSIDALVHANGLDAEDFLRIGQAIIIPLDEGEVERGSLQAPVDRMILPTPTALPLEVGPVQVYKSPSGGLVCLGEISNGSGAAVTNLQVEVTLVGSNETPLMTVRTWAASDYLSPGGHAPFAVRLLEAPQGVAGARARLVRAEAVGAITAGFVPLEAGDVVGKMAGPQYHVAGWVRNVGSQPVTRVSIVVTLYDEGGAVIGFRQVTWSEDRVLAPGDQEVFELTVTPMGARVPQAFTWNAWGVAQ